MARVNVNNPSPIETRTIYAFKSLPTDDRLATLKSIFPHGGVYYHDSNHGYRFSLPGETDDKENNLASVTKKLEDAGLKDIQLKILGLEIHQ